MQKFWRNFSWRYTWMSARLFDSRVARLLSFIRFLFCLLRPLDIVAPARDDATEEDAGDGNAPGGRPADSLSPAPLRLTSVLPPSGAACAVPALL